MRYGRRRPVPALAALMALGATVLAYAVSRSIHRVEVTGSSMAPALLPGDRLVVLGAPRWLRSATPASRMWARWTAAGAVVAVPDPREPSRLLVKRVATVDRRSGTIEVHGDDPSASTDSRTFGPVPAPSVVGRAVYRYGPPGRTGRLGRPGEYHSP